MLNYAPQLVIAYVAQRQRLEAAIPMRVRDYVRGGAERGWSFLKPHKPPGCDAHLKALAQRLRFAELLDRPIAALSEGQKQRVCLGRALIAKPDVLVLDEPTSAMDMAAEADLFASLGALAAEHAMAVIVVGHHLPALLAATSHWAWAQGSKDGLVCGSRSQLLAHTGFVSRYAAMLAPAAKP
jgi:ABC-type Mn2+/Zn2+ transport system ATPase subunit